MCVFFWNIGLQKELGCVLNNNALKMGPTLSNEGKAPTPAGAWVQDLVMESHLAVQ